MEKARVIKMAKERVTKVVMAETKFWVPNWFLPSRPHLPLRPRHPLRSSRLLPPNLLLFSEQGVKKITTLPVSPRVPKEKAIVPAAKETSASRITLRRQLRPAPPPRLSRLKDEMLNGVIYTSRSCFEKMVVEIAFYEKVNEWNELTQNKKKNVCSLHPISISVFVLFSTPSNHDDFF